MSETQNPEVKPVVIRNIAVNGKTLSFVQKEFSSRSKTNKGKPLLAPVFSADGKNFIPTAQDLGTVLAALGADALLKAFAQQILIPAAKDASEASVKTDAAGVSTIDNGDFARELLKAVAAFTQTAAKLDELKAQEAELNDALAKVTSEVFALIGAQKPVPPELTNKASQLLLKRDELMKSMQKKSNRGAKKDAATPATPAK